MSKDISKPIIQYECPICGDLYATRAECLRHIKDHDDEKELRMVVMDLNCGKCVLEVRNTRRVAKDTTEENKVIKGSSAFWYIEVEDDVKSILNAKRRLKTAVLRWLRRQAKMVKELKIEEAKTKDEQGIKGARQPYSLDGRDGVAGTGINKNQDGASIRGDTDA